MRAAKRTRPTYQPLLGVIRPYTDRQPSGAKATCEAGPPGCAAACHEEGTCTDKAGECLASSDADCRASMVCARNGRCTVDPKTHTCVARVDADCAAADVCLRGGRNPTAQADTRVCMTRPGVDVCSSEICARTESCAIRGACAAVSGICAPTEPAHCANSRACKVRGLCTYRDYTCFGSSQTDCDVSYECLAYGRCKYTPSSLSSVGYCIDPAVGEAHSPCLQTACWLEDKCLLSKTGTCVTPASASLPPLLPPEPTRPFRMQANVDDRSLVLTHALARRVSADLDFIVTDIRLGARPFDCGVFDNPGSPTIRLRTQTPQRRVGYVLTSGAVRSVQWATEPPLTTNRSARFATETSLGLTPTPIEIDLDTNALPSRTLSVHGDLIAQPCPP